MSGTGSVHCYPDILDKNYTFLGKPTLYLNSPNKAILKKTKVFALKKQGGEHGIISRSLSITTRSKPQIFMRNKEGLSDPHYKTLKHNLRLSS